MVEGLRRLDGVVLEALRLGIGIGEESWFIDDDSAAKMLQILEKIGSSNEEGFRQIEQKMSKLIETGAKSEDMRKLGEEIRTSSESVVNIIDKMLAEIMVRNYRNYGAIFELATNMTSFLSTPSQQHRKILQMMKDDLVILGLYDSFADDPIFTNGHKTKEEMRSFKDHMAGVIRGKFGSPGESAFEAAINNVLFAMMVYQGHNESPETLNEYCENYIKFLTTMGINDAILRYTKNGLDRWIMGSCGREDIGRCIQLFDWYFRKLGDRGPTIGKLENFLSGDLLPCDAGFDQKADQLLAELRSEFYSDIIHESG